MDMINPIKTLSRLKIRMRFHFISLFIGLVLSAQLLAVDHINEYQVKAAFLYNFIAFTQWPEGIDQTLNLCVYGEDYFGQEIDKLQEKSVNNNNIKILRLTSLEKSRECHVLFISKSIINNLPGILASVQEKPVLTIADSPEAATQGVIINMNLTQNKVNFEVNLESARSVGLDISARLLQLATKVYQ
ncbi:MAG: YfiR family protein [Betaproteobacteria bacterium]|nr:YfiR family protein [Betaproteobacteria bacterium]